MWRSLLTLPVSCGFLDFPKDLERRIRRLCHSSQNGKKCGHSCFCQQPAIGAPYERRSILVEQRPVSVRTGGLSRAGERCSAFFCVQIPKTRGVFMLRFLFSSRWTRFQYRLVASLQFFLCRAAATAVLRAVLALPVLYFVEVL